MLYTKEAGGLSQDQAIENLKAVISSDYFKAYEFLEHSRVFSDMVDANSIGSWKKETMGPFKVKDLTGTLVALLDAIKSDGNLYEAHIRLTPPEERMRAMSFEERLYQDDFNLPLTFSIPRKGRSGSDNRSFSVINLGFKESYFESEGLDLKDARKKLTMWYREVTRNLKKILPIPVQNPTS